MFLSYSASVILVSLALYGLWYASKEIWAWIIMMKFVRLPAASFVILVHNMEYEVEELLRYLVNELTDGGQEYDTIVVDCGSDDLTPAILRRLAEELTVLTVVNAPRSSRPVTEILPLCRGAVVHVLDLTGRLTSEQFTAVVSALLRQSQQDVAVRRDR